jgi:phosphoribosylglycinamide formyltransferase
MVQGKRDCVECRNRIQVPFFTLTLLRQLEYPPHSLYFPSTMESSTATEQAQRIHRITVLISGSGSNLQALIDAAGTDRLPNAKITFVLSSRSNAYGLTRASTQTPPIPTSVCALKTFLNRNPGATRENYDAEVARRVLDSKPDLVVLAGWMHILSPQFLEILNGTTEPPPAPALPPPDLSSLPTQTESSASQSTSNTTSSIPSHALRFPVPCINLHPALPGAFDGADAIGRAYTAFQEGTIEKTGVMVHRVVAEVDRGEPLVVRDIPIKQGETKEELETKIHQVSTIISPGTKADIRSSTRSL